MRMRAAPLLLGVTLVAGCGGGSGGTTTNREHAKPAKQVVADAVRAARRASAVHVFGHVRSGKTPLALDLTLVRGKGATGSVSENGLSFDLVQVGDTVYIKGSDAFWRKYAGSAATLLHGRWISAPAGKGEFAQLAPLTSAAKLFALVESTHGRLVNRGPATYQGQSVVEIRDTSDGSKLYVSATGTPYPVALAGGGKHADDQLRFHRWNGRTSLSAPQHAIDVSQLAAG